MIIICCGLCWEVPAEGVLTVQVVIRYCSRQLLLLRLWSQERNIPTNTMLRRQLKIILKTVFAALLNHCIKLRIMDECCFILV